MGGLAGAGRTLPDKASLRERYEAICRHLDLYASYSGEALALLNIRKQLLLYVADLPGVKEFRTKLPSLTSRQVFGDALKVLFESAIEEPGGHLPQSANTRS